MRRLFHNGAYENLRMALETLRQHKLRSALTILGVVVGTMTVIVIAAFVSGIDDRVSKEIESFGTNSIYAYRFDPGFNINPSAEEDRKSTRLNSSHANISYAVFCLKKKNKTSPIINNCRKRR